MIGDLHKIFGLSKLACYVRHLIISRAKPKEEESPVDVKVAELQSSIALLTGTLEGISKEIQTIHHTVGILITHAGGEGNQCSTTGSRPTSVWHSTSLRPRSTFTNTLASTSLHNQ